MADNHGEMVIGNFTLNRNEVKKATVQKIYKDENWRNTDKILGAYNEHLFEFKCDSDED